MRRSRGHDGGACQTSVLAPSPVTLSERPRAISRHLVLATGRDGLGRAYLPAFAHQAHRRFWAHTSDDIDFARLAGKRIAVIGAGASAIDNAELAGSPYLGPSFEFLEKSPGACPALDRVHCFNFPATLSHGKLTGDIPGISEGAQRLAQGLARRLFVADRELDYRSLEAYDVPELQGDEWTDADAPGRSDAA